MENIEASELKARARGFEPVAHRCPSCGAAEMRLIYEVRDVPVHSCLMLSDVKDARAFPRGDIRLGLCERCGFIANTAYDEKWALYDTNYEDQQSYSPTFNNFARELAGRLIAKYDLRHKSVLEIGCSKGDFLALLCELGENRGVGVDPSAVIGRVKSPAIERIIFVQDYYSEDHAKYESDLICCRHTLEHIAPVSEFMSLVRRAIGGRRTPIFFELPDMGRVLRDLAFEDIYYEHCSYFTPGSLARLLEGSTFDTTDLALAYDGQYILIDGKPAGERRAPPLGLAEPPAQTVRDARHFAENVDRALNTWREKLRRMRYRKERVVVWGSGSKCVSFLTTLNMNDAVDFIVDINPHRHGKFIPGLGKEIMPPAFLQEYKPHCVIIMNAIYRREIQAQLAAMNVAAEIMTL